MRLSALLYDAYKNWCEANIFRAYTLILIKYIGKVLSTSESYIQVQVRKEQLILQNETSPSFLRSIVRKL